MIPASAPAPAVKPAADDAYRVMVVDDSVVIRAAMTRALESDPQIKVVASVGNGQMAINALPRADIDVIVLDIEMPVMDGLTALPKLLAASPDTRIVMASTLTQKNAQISLKALAAGATDYVPKPTSVSEMGGAAQFTRDLVEKVRALAEARRRRGIRGRTGHAQLGRAARGAPAPMPGKPISLHAPGTAPAELLVVGSSTGGPQALLTFLSALPATVRHPILITQHMPPTFTKILAEHLAKASRRPTAEGADGEVIQPGRIYIAPGDNHMKLVVRDGQRRIQLSKEPPENFCRPAVDVMLRSVVQCCGGRALCVILTGMGADGAKGAEKLVAAGGTVVAQDEGTSVVWGMPGAVAAAGLCSAVLPLNEIAPHVARMLQGKSS